MNWCDHIHSDPGTLCGKPVFRGMRVNVERVLKLVGAGWDAARIAEEYPGVSSTHLQAAAAFAADLMHGGTDIAIDRARAA